MSNKQLRVTLRWTHIIIAVFIGVMLYSPLGTNDAYLALMRFGVFPLLGLTGIAMWQQPKLGKLLKRFNGNQEAQTS